MFDIIAHTRNAPRRVPPSRRSVAPTRPSPSSDTDTSAPMTGTRRARPGDEMSRLQHPTRTTAASRVSRFAAWTRLLTAGSSRPSFRLR